MSYPTSSWPLVIPIGWECLPEQDGLKIIRKVFPNGLTATFSIEHWHGPERAACGPMEQVGTFRRLVLSRSNRYPGWDEMRDFIRSCGLFDRKRDVAMIIPPDDEYCNLHNFAFHWWQKETP